MRKISFLASIIEALQIELQRDESVFIMGEGIGPNGGAFRETQGLFEEFGEERIRDTPISEAGFTGAAVGAALCGMRPVVDLMYVDFTTVAMDQIINQAAKIKYLSAGKMSVPIVILGAFGIFKSGGAHHGQPLHAWFANIPGLKIIVPSTAYDVKGLLITAIRDNNPTLFWIHRGLFSLKDDVPQDAYTIPFGEAAIKREGKDITIVSTARMVHLSLEAAVILSKRDISVEIIDLRTIVPLDRRRILESVKKTGRLLVVDEGYAPCGLGAEVMALMADEGFDYLDAPLKRLCTNSVPIPFSPSLEQFIIPDVNKIITAVEEII